MQWLRNNKFIMVSLVLGLVAIIAGTASFIFIDKLLAPHQQTDVTPHEQLEEEAESPLEPPVVQDPWLELARERNVMVIIDNHPLARPQGGLQEGDLVYEFPIEGGSSRFMAMYSRFSPQLVGPIRSARDYNIRLALEHDSIFIHAGGSPGAFRLLNNIDSLNGLGGGVDRAFWRVNEKTEPHNLYSDGATLRRVANQEGFKNQGQLLDFRYLGSDDEFLGKEAKKISIEYGDALYKAEYLYDESSQRYLRFTAGVQHWDPQGRQLTVKNIMVQMVNTKVIDDEGRLSLDLDGQGRALYFVEGRVFQGFWQQKQGVTKFFKAEGEEIALREGNTWINIVPIDRKITY